MSKKKTTKKAAARPINPKKILLITAVLIALVAGIFCLPNWLESNSPTEGYTGVATGNFQPIPTSPTVNVEDLKDFDNDPYKGLQLVKIGNYSGLFMEDGGEDIVTHVLMIIVKNTGAKTVQYGEIELTNGQLVAHFTLSTLPPGESVVLLEQNRMAYADGKDLSEATIKNVAIFNQEPMLCEDRIQIQSLNGVLNVKNISDKDITGDIVIYYKNASIDLLYGGITYRVTIKGGIQAGAIKQITASHFTPGGSRIMWISVS